MRLSKRVKKEKQFRMAFRQNELYLFQKGNICQLNRDCTADEQAELLPYDQKWEVAHEDIHICKQLGSGAFGRVVEALVKGLEGPKSETLVAIKMCKNQADPAQVRALAIELKIMIHLGQHLNIVNLLGANTRNIGRGELWILLEYCHHGNLLSFMHRHRQCFINQVDPITDNIDPMMLVPAADGIVSPSTSYRRNSTQAARSERTLSVPAAFPSSKLTSPPGSRADEAFASSTTDCSLSPATIISQPRQQVQNPLYNFFNRLSHEASEDIKMMSVPHEASEDNKMVSIPPHEVSENNNIVSIPPHEASEDNKMMSVPHEVSENNNIVSIPAHEASEDNKIASVPPRKASEDTCCGRPQTELEKGTENMQAVSSASSDLLGMNTDSTAFSSSQMSSSEQPPASPEGRNGYVSDPFGCDIGKVPGVSAPFATSDLVNWAWQVAQGMNYLTSRKVLHGDLAARNLLLADHNIVKISDFGLSRDMYKKDIYMKQGDDLMPIKWLSVEAIRDLSFSVQSDVWAFGITMWELFTLGSIPYPGIEVDKDFLQLLESGHRMAKPKYANHKIYDLMLECWALEPRNRPSFFDAASVLGELMHSNLRTEYAALNDPYQRMNEERFKVETDFLSMLANPDIDHIRQGHSPNTHYVNIQRAGEGPQGGSNTAHRPPAGLEYSPEGPGTPSPQPPSSEYGDNYLPMSASITFPNSNNIFSPRPNTEPRFTFDKDELEASSAKNDVLNV
nr:vascular endothelial growth factor receptor 1-like [Procambarus clarkii]